MGVIAYSVTILQIVPVNSESCTDGIIVDACRQFLLPVYNRSIIRIPWRHLTLMLQRAQILFPDGWSYYNQFETHITILKLNIYFHSSGLFSDYLNWKSSSVIFTSTIVSRVNIEIMKIIFYIDDRFFFYFVNYGFEVSWNVKYIC